LNAHADLEVARRAVSLSVVTMQQQQQ